jgi:predicted secreted protein
MNNVVTNKDQQFTLLDQETVSKYNSYIKYVLIACSNPECGKTWGIVLSERNQTLTREMLTCRRCATKKYLEMDSNEVE